METQNIAMSQAITPTTLTESLRCHEVVSVRRHTSMSSPPRVVDGVSEPRRVYDGEPQFDSFLLDADRVFDDADGLIDSFCGGTRTCTVIQQSGSGHFPLHVRINNKCLLTLCAGNLPVFVEVGEEQTFD